MLMMDLNPGVKGSLEGVEGSWDFFLKVFRGREYCEVRFHIILRDGSFHWGEGGYQE